MNDKRFYLPLFLFILTFFTVSFFSSRPVPEVVEKRLDKLPYEIGAWSGTDFSFEERVIEELNTDVAVSRHYSNKDKVINLYIGYYGTKKGGRTGHNPNACYPSAGWSIRSDEYVVLPGGPEVNRLFITKGEANQVVYHWYQARDTIIKAGLEQNVLRFLGLLIHNRNDGAFVSVSSTLEDEALVGDFSKKLIPIIASLWPVER